MTQTRKLAAIMFTDIVGYSRLMSADEVKGLALLAEHDVIVLKEVAKHDGNVLKQMGDAVFAEFDSSANAVNCAVEIQIALKARNENKSGDERILIRIGLHLGDVSVQGDDLFGEGINVAARLEPLAQPGGICMSQAIYQSVKSHTDISAIRVGEIELKNIIEKYTIYKVPSLYEEYRELATGEEEEDTELLDFEIKSVEIMPPPSRSYWKTVGLYLVAMPLFMILGALAGIFLSDEPGIRRSEVKEMGSLILKLQDRDHPVTSALRSKLDIETVALIDQYAVTDSVTANLSRKVRRNINGIIRNGTIIFEPQILATLHLSREIDELIRSEPEGNNLSYLNRLIVGRTFRSEIQEIPYSFSQTVGVIVQFFRTDPAAAWFRKMMLAFLLVVILLVFTSAYQTALTTRRVRFRDVREVDQLLSHFTEQMGFKEPVKAKGVLVFKPTKTRLLKDIFLGFPARIRVKVDGNSAVITSTIPYVKRLMKQLEAYSA